METLLHSDNIFLGRILCSVVESLVLETQKALLFLILLIGCQFDDRNMLTSLTAVDHRFPFDELTTVKEPVEENNDAGENDDTESENDDDDDDESVEEGSEYEEEDSDDDAEANGDSDSDSDEDDDDDNDKDDDDDDDNDEDEDDDDEDEEEEPKEPPSKKKK